MADLRIDYPGIGGSLGECVVCGKSFVGEILLGMNTRVIRLTVIPKDLPVHTACGDQVAEIKDGDWRKLPEGPLRRCFEEANAELSELGR